MENRELESEGWETGASDFYCVAPIRCSVGITAYNEEENVGKLLEALINQQLYTVQITEIIVVASGCTDHTEEIIQEYCTRDARIKLFVQPRREGKTSAINIFLQNAREDICVLESGDTLPRYDSIENMVRMFRDPQVGMTGAQKVAVNTPESIIAAISHLRLKMEHDLCLEIPRLGELIAFRKVFDQVPPDVAMDEAFVEAVVIKRGLEVRYAPDAVVFNMGPTTVGDFIKQRRRNYAGHIHLQKKYGYRVSSLDNWRVVRLWLGEIWSALRLIYTLIVIAAVEVFARMLGAFDYYVQGNKHVVWDIAWTTKHVDAPAENPQGNAPRADRKTV